MVLSIVKDAIHIKMKLKNESPLISVFEFCYAAGLGCRIMGMDAGQFEKFRNAEAFMDMKAEVQELVKSSEKFADDPQKERLKNLIAGCRIRGDLSEDARLLFDMGYTGE